MLVISCVSYDTYVYVTDKPADFIPTVQWWIVPGTETYL